MTAEQLLEKIGAGDPNTYARRINTWANGVTEVALSHSGTNRHAGKIKIKPDGAVEADEKARENFPGLAEVPQPSATPKTDPETTQPTHGSPKQVAEKVGSLIEGQGSDHAAKVVRFKNGDLKVFIKVKHPNPKRGWEEKGAVVIHPDGTVEPDRDAEFALKTNRDLLTQIRSLRAESEDRSPWANQPTKSAIDSRTPPDDPLERMEWEQARRNPDPLERG